MGLLLIFRSTAVVVQAPAATVTFGAGTPTIGGDQPAAIPIGVGGISTEIPRRDKTIRAPAALVIFAPVHHQTDLTQGEDPYILDRILSPV